MESQAVVYIVHCIDAEGPLYESLEATFDRIEQIFGLRLPVSRQTLRKLQSKELDLGGQEESIAMVVSPKLLAYNDTWDKIDAMLERIGDPKFRLAQPDSYGGGWIYNWHCVDHYRGFSESTQAADTIHWHFHPTHHERHIGPAPSISGIPTFSIF